MTGTQNSAIDFEWLLANLEIGKVPYGVDGVQLGLQETFVLGPKALFAAEQYILALFQLYPTVYFHKATRGAEKLFEELLSGIYSLVQSGDVGKTGLPPNHPLVKFFRDGAKVDDLLELDDTVIWGSLSMLSSSADVGVAELAIRLRDRKLFKAIDVRQLLSRKYAGDEDGMGKALDRVRKEVSDWNQINSLGYSRIMIDKSARSPYKPLEESSGPLDQIHIRMPDDDLKDIRTVSNTVSSIKTFRLFRAYIAREDAAAESFLNKVIESENKDGLLPSF